MSDTLDLAFRHDSGGGLYAEQELGSNANYTLDFGTGMAAGELLTSATWTADNPTQCVLSNQTFGDTTASVNVADGTGAAGNWCLVTCVAASNQGNSYSKSFRVYFAAPAQLGTDIVSVFPNLVFAVMSVRRDRLLTASSDYFPDAELTDEYILEKLVAAEADLSRQLRVFFQPRVVLPNSVLQSEIDSYTNNGQQVYLEPGYDYDPNIFIGNRWGFQQLRQRPVQSLIQVSFAYPAPTDTLFIIPSNWFRIDQKYGVLNMVPVQTAISLPLNAFILSALGGGRTVPLMLQIRYIAGLANVAADYPDILDAIKRQAVLGIINDNYVPSSGSASVDGLSQSLAFDIDRYQKQQDKKIETLRSSIHGIRIEAI